MDKLNKDLEELEIDPNAFAEVFKKIKSAIAILKISIEGCGITEYSIYERITIAGKNYVIEDPKDINKIARFLVRKITDDSTEHLIITIDSKPPILLKNKAVNFCTLEESIWGKL